MLFFWFDYLSMCQNVSVNVSLPFWRLQQPAAVRFANMAVAQHRNGGVQIGHGSPILFATSSRVGREPKASGRHPFCHLLACRPRAKGERPTSLGQPPHVSAASRRRAADILGATSSRVGREPKASGRHQHRDLQATYRRPTANPRKPRHIKFATVIRYVGWGGSHPPSSSAMRACIWWFFCCFCLYLPDCLQP